MAVYADLGKDCSTDRFLVTHRKFQAIRGGPDTFYSDPGKNFIGASAELKMFFKSIDKGELENEGGNVGTKCHFHPPDASHANGAV